MKKFSSIASILTLAATLGAGAAYAVQGAEPETDPVLEIIASNPSEGEEMPALAKGSIITMTPALFAEYPDMWVEFEGQELQEDGKWAMFKEITFMNRDNDKGYYQQEVMMDYPMYAGVEYRLKFTAWSDMGQRNYNTDDVLGVGYVYLKGTGTRYEPSSIKLTEIWPLDSGNDAFAETGYLYDDIPFLRVVFDGAVNLGTSQDTGIVIGSGVGMEPFASFEAEGASETINGKEYAKIWHLNFPDGYIARQSAPIIISIKAFDTEGRVVQGTEGEGAGSYSIFYYNVPGQYADVEIDFGSGYPESVSSITAINTDYGINFSHNRAESEAKVYLDGKVAATVSRVTQKFDEGQESNPEAVAYRAVMTLSKKLSTPGVYTLSIPDKYFSIGTQFITFFQKPINMKFTLGNPTVDFTPTPAAGIVDELSVITLDYDVDADLVIADDTDKPYLYYAEEDVKVAGMQVSAEGKTLKIELRNTMTEKGNYSLVIPMGFVSAGGKDLPAVSVEYTIDNTLPVDMTINFTPASGSTLEALPTQIDFAFPQFEDQPWNLGGGKATIQFNDEEPVELSDALFDLEAPMNEGWQPLDDFAGKTESGVYVVTFPAGYFLIGDSGLPSPEFTAKYIVEGKGGLTFDPADGAELGALPESIFFDFGQEYLAYAEYSDTYATISKDGGEAVNLPQLEYSYSWVKGTGYQPLGDFAGCEEKGLYTITFPDNYFRLGSWSADVEKSSTMVESFSITYQVNGTGSDGVEIVGINADHYLVYDLQGNLVLDTDDASQLKTLKGIYLVNGLKIALK